MGVGVAAAVPSSAGMSASFSVLLGPGYAAVSSSISLATACVAGSSEITSPLLMLISLIPRSCVRCARAESISFSVSVDSNVGGGVGIRAVELEVESSAGTADVCVSSLG